MTYWVTASTDWATISAFATACGTLVLAIATFASVRSANRSARLAELALQEQLRPVLVNSNIEDPEQKIMFVDAHWVRVSGSGAVVEEGDGNLYLALSLRNVGAGIAVLLGWYPWPDLEQRAEQPVAAEEFRILTRDLYIPPGGIGLWQGALRDPSEPIYGDLSAACAERRGFLVDLLYADHIGGQRSISRFSLMPAQERWIGSVARHWNLDRPGPRDGDRVAQQLGAAAPAAGRGRPGA
ncbi:MAG TPA: hypothetical protein VGY97_02980 [Solirubrobacteraceae bacterium]|jgi:hypothetical protein|nr:hypothetical protein [Solirubrobacteraceae bacterium]